MTGDALLLEARILEAAGRRAEAVKTLDEGLRRAVTEPSVVQRVVLLLLRLDRKQDALGLLERAIRASPQEPGLALAKAIVLGLMDRAAEAEKAVKEVEARWPKLDRAYLAHALLLERTGRAREARQMLRTAVLLGSQAPDLECAQARLAGTPSRNPECARRTGLEHLLLPVCATEAQ
jgi:tetratricopeptide (TPR) repeat protein